MLHLELQHTLRFFFPFSSDMMNAKDTKCLKHSVKWQQQQQGDDKTLRDDSWGGADPWLLMMGISSSWRVRWWRMQRLVDTGQTARRTVLRERYLREGWSFKEGRKGHESLQQSGRKDGKGHRWERSPQVKDTIAGGDDLRPAQSTVMTWRSLFSDCMILKRWHSRINRLVGKSYDVYVCY